MPRSARTPPAVRSASDGSDEGAEGGESPFSVAIATGKGLSPPGPAPTVERRREPKDTPIARDRVACLGWPHGLARPRSGASQGPPGASRSQRGGGRNAGLWKLTGLGHLRREPQLHRRLGQRRGRRRQRRRAGREAVAAGG